MLGNSKNDIVNNSLLNFIPGIILISLTLYFALQISDLKINYDIDAFYSENDPELEIYNDFKNSFENENDYLLIGIKSNEGIFNQDFLYDIDRLTELIKAKKYVKQIFSPTKMYETVKSFGTPFKVPLIHLDDTTQFAADKKKIYASSIYPFLFFSSDTNSISLIIQLHKDNQISNDSICSEINQLTNSFHFKNTHFAGRLFTQKFYKKQMKGDMFLFASISLILLVISMILIYRSIYISSIIVISLFISLIFVYGTLSLLHLEINLLLTMLPLLLIITGISPAIHLLTQYRENKNPNSKSALIYSFNHTIFPNTINTFTTIVGFGTLYLLPIKPVQEFAIISVLGISITFIITLGSVTYFIYLQKSKKSIPVNDSSEMILRHFQKLTRNKKTILMFTISIIIMSIFSMNKISTENKFLDDLPKHSELGSDLNFFENYFSGIRPLEILLTPKNIKDTTLTLDKLKEIKFIQSNLISTFYSKSSISPVNIVELANKSLNGGHQEDLKLPEDEKSFQKINRKINKGNTWKKFIPLFETKTGKVRITCKTTDNGSLFNESATENFYNSIRNKTKYYDIRITGASYLMDKANRKITSILLSGLFLMTLVVFMILLLLFKSLKISFIGLMVNITPVFAVFPILYYSGIPLKISSALIFTIVYGIAVDDTIHFLSSYKKFRNHLSVDDSISETLKGTGKSMIITSIILSVGFSILTLSAFPSISIIGTVIAITLFIALICDLLLLPILLLKYDK